MTAWIKSVFRASGSPPENPDAISVFGKPSVIVTEDLILRPVSMRDAADIFHYASDPDVARYVLWEPHRSISDTRSFIRYLLSLYRRGLPSSWAVEHKKDGIVIGMIGFMGYTYIHHAAEIGYSFSRTYWNRGYATQALSAVIRTSFSAITDLNRIEAQHDTRNPASGRVMVKCGMRPEGILRGRLFNKGEFVDVVLYSILRSDLFT